MSTPRDFDKDLNEAAPWEKRIAEKIRIFMMRYNIDMITYDNLEDIKRQKNGLDFFIKSESAGWEIKTRASKYYRKGILLETTSVVETNKLGWLYTSKADVIAYVWLNESLTNLMPIGYFIMIKELRKTPWYDRLPGRYHVFHTDSERKTSDGMISWRTEFICPPIENFPKDTLYKFNAILPSNYKQTILPVGEGSEKCDEG